MIVRSARIVFCVVSGLALLLIAGRLVSQGRASTEATTIATSGTGVFHQVAHMGGSVSAVEIVGNLAYIGMGSRLAILDVSNPGAPRYLGETEPLSGTVEVVVVEGAYAYVACNYFDLNGSLSIIEVGSYRNPRQVGFVATSTPGYDVAVNGRYAYLAAGSGGIKVIDVLTSSAPTEVRTVSTPGDAYGVKVASGYLYVAADTAGLRVMTLSNPAAPTQVGFLDTPGNAYGVTVKEQTAYVADGTSGLRIVDVGTPASPFELGSYATFYDTVGVDVADGKAVIVGGASYLLDVSVPSSPSWEGVLPALDTLADVTIESGLAYVAGRCGGFQVIDISSSEFLLPEIGRYDPPSCSNALAHGDNGYLYVGSVNASLVAIDVSNPRYATVVYSEGDTSTVGHASHDMAVANDHLYINDHGTLNVYDLSTPDVPRIVGTCHPESGTIGAHGLAVQGQYAFLATYDQTYGTSDHGLTIIDVSTPSNLSTVTTLDTWGVAQDVVVSGTHAYVADGEWLQIIDISDPEHPASVGVYTTSTGISANAVAVWGDYAYVSGGGLHIVDVSDPSNPQQAGFFPGAAGAASTGGLAADDGYLFATHGWSLYVYDVYSPTNPTQIAAVPLHGYTTHPVLDEPYVYVGVVREGIAILESQALLPSPSALTVFTLPGDYTSTQRVDLTSPAGAIRWSVPITPPMTWYDTVPLSGTTPSAITVSLRITPSMLGKHTSVITIGVGRQPLFGSYVVPVTLYVWNEVHTTFLPLVFRRY